MANKTREISQNLKYNPKRQKEEEKVQMEQRKQIQDDRFKPKNINKHIKYPQ